MNATNWLSSKLNLLRNSAPASVPPEEVTRSTRERLGATLRVHKEALSPRSLRRTLLLLQSVVDPKVSEVEGGRRAKALADWYAKAEASERQDLWLLISEQFGPDPLKVRAARVEYDAALGSVDEGAAEIRLRRALVSPRTRLRGGAMALWAIRHDGLQKIWVAQITQGTLGSIRIAVAAPDARPEKDETRVALRELLVGEETEVLQQSKPLGQREQ